jgi:hypothetical protein
VGLVVVMLMCIEGLEVLETKVMRGHVGVGGFEYE